MIDTHPPRGSAFTLTGLFSVLMLSGLLLGGVCVRAEVPADIRLTGNGFVMELDGNTGRSWIADGKQGVSLRQVRHRGDLRTFAIDLAAELNREEGAFVDLTLGHRLEDFPDERAGFGASFYRFVTPFISIDPAGSVLEVEQESLAEIPALSTGQWFGWASRYDVVAVRVVSGMDSARLHVLKDDEDLSPETLALRIAFSAGSGSQGTLVFDYLTVAKTPELLASPDIHLQGVLFIGLWDWFRKVCLWFWELTDYLAGLTGNPGMSLILLALIVRIVTFPITRYAVRYQEVSIEQTARTAPGIKAIKEKYQGVEQSEKIIELYDRERYDHLAPFKSMMGLLVQIPVFAALFNVLGENRELQGQSFLWIQDLSRSDRLFDWGWDIPWFGAYLNLLPFILGGVTVLSTWLAARHAGNRDLPKRNLFGMGLLFFVLFYSFPSALVLYWLSSSVFQLLQQSFENRWVGGRNAGAGK